MGKNSLELRAKLGGQGFVVGQHQGGSLDPFDDLGHGEGLTTAGDALGVCSSDPVQSPGNGVNGLRLIAGGFIWADNFRIRA